MVWLVAAVILVLALGAFHHFGAKPAIHRGTLQSDFERFLTTLELGGREGAVLFISHLRSDRFVQVVRTGAPPGPDALGISVPLAAWALRDEPALRAALRSGDERLVERRGTDGMRFLDAEPLSVTDAGVLVRRLLRAMELDDEAPLTLHFEGPMRIPELERFSARLAEHRAAARLT